MKFIRTAMYIACLLLVQAAFGQQAGLRPGFDKTECMEMMKIARLQSQDTAEWGKPSVVPKPQHYSFVYRSPLVGLQNMWDLWVGKDSVAVISIRGTDVKPNPVSWMANVYAAMVPAKGALQLDKDFTFSYDLCDDPKAAVHIGYLVATAYLSRDILPRIDSCYKRGIKSFIIAGHSQGGAICYLLTSHLLSLQAQQKLPADIRFKTYASAAPKVGNLYYAYRYESLTRNWAFNTVNSSDWVPEVPVSIQTIHDFNDISPFRDAKKTINKQGFAARHVLKHVYKRLVGPPVKAQRRYEHYLGKMVAKAVKKNILEFKEPVYYKSNNYVRTGTTIVLYADDEYKKVFPQKPEEVWQNHLIDHYLYLAAKLPDSVK